MKTNKWKTFRRRSRLIWLILFTAIALTVSTAMLSKREAMVSEVLIDIDPLAQGGELLTKEEVRKLLDRKFPSKNQERLSKVPLQTLEEAVRAHPMVQEAEVYVDARNRVRVHIVQPEPLIRVIDQRGAGYYLDAQGERIPLSRHFSPRIPVATGAIPAYRDSILNHPDHILAQLVEMGQRIEEDEFMQALVEQIDVHAGEIYLVPKMGKFRILMGDAKDLDKKFSRLKSFYRHILPAVGWSYYELVNLSFDKQIVCRKA